MPPRPPSAPQRKPGRRTFLALLTIVGAVLSFAPFVPFGTFLSGSLQGSGNLTKPQRVVIDNTSSYGAAAGKAVQVSDTKTFPPNSHWVITYPSSGDATIDAQNPNTFVKFELIRLPSELGGDKASAGAFVAFSKVCVHLWCSPNYNPMQCTTANENGYVSGPTCAQHELYECPCHGSAYSVGVNKKAVGLAVAGPASVQPAPTNAIPVLKLSTDSSGFLQIEAPQWDVEHNGVLGYGRDITSQFSTQLLSS